MSGAQKNFFFEDGKKFWLKINDFEPKKDPPGSGNYDDPDLNLMFFFNILVKTF